MKRLLVLLVTASLAACATPAQIQAQRNALADQDYSACLAQGIAPTADLAPSPRIPPALSARATTGVTNQAFIDCLAQLQSNRDYAEALYWASQPPAVYLVPPYGPYGAYGYPRPRTCEGGFTGYAVQGQEIQITCY